jgi:hypothetical protein
MNNSKLTKLVAFICTTFDELKNDGVVESADQLDYLFKNPPLNFLNTEKITMLKYRELCVKISREMYALKRWNEHFKHTNSLNN